jgi:hypothetical protein
MVELPISEHGHPKHHTGGTNSPEITAVEDTPNYPFRVFIGHIASSSMSNILGVIAGHPFDTIKVSDSQGQAINKPRLI